MGRALFVAIVCLSRSISELDDSKKLSSKKRQVLFKRIKKEAHFIGIGASSARYIDKHGLTKATIYAGNKALAGLGSFEGKKFIIDGNYDYLPRVGNKELVIKADSKFACVSAASIVAKVCRDKYMKSLAINFPEYGFEKHFGYGTKQHKESLIELGVSSIHRKSFKPVQDIL